MDIALLKTFIEVYRTRHFGHAAENLYITQSAVSARIRLLEETLGILLFKRDRNNIQLTAAGLRFLKHADAIVNAWNRARQEMALEEESKVPLSIGGMYSLWDIALQDFIHHIYQEMPNVALQAEAHSPDALIRRLLDGVLDLGFMFEPPQMAELVEEEIGEINLVMVSSQEGLSIDQAVNAPDYIMVDWGTAFATAHARHFPDMPAPTIHIGLGRIALAFILNCGGVAYLAKAMVTHPIEEKHLFYVQNAPPIMRKYYAVYPHTTSRIDVINEVLKLFKH
jgi:DNA-binding transcriptional LysR family regulator